MGYLWVVQAHWNQSTGRCVGFGSFQRQGGDGPGLLNWVQSVSGRVGLALTNNPALPLRELIKGLLSLLNAN